MPVFRSHGQGLLVGPPGLFPSGGCFRRQGGCSGQCLFIGALGIPKGFEICQAITIGYYDTDKTPKTPQRKSVDEATTWFLKDAAAEPKGGD